MINNHPIIRKKPYYPPLLLIFIYTTCYETDINLLIKDYIKEALESWQVYKDALSSSKKQQY